jgi:hypothetical protein
MQVGRSLIAAIATVGGLIIAGIVLATRAAPPVTTGAQAMVGESAEVVADFSGQGVRYGGSCGTRAARRALRAGEQAPS